MLKTSAMLISFFTIALLFTGCADNLFNRKPLEVTQVIYSSGNDSVSPNFAWRERYTINKEGLHFWRSGTAANLNIGTWKIRSFGKHERTLFNTLSDRSLLTVKKVREGGMAGGGSVFYAVTYEGGREVNVSLGSNSTYIKSEFLTVPIRAYLNTVTLPDEIAMTKVQRVVSKPSMNSIYFAFDSSELDSAAKVILSAYAEYLRLHENINITLEGNTDSRGSRGSNLSYGQRLADAAKEFLVREGLKRDRIDTVSFGEEQPQCLAETGACFAQNRRVDIVFR